MRTRTVSTACNLALLVLAANLTGCGTTWQQHQSAPQAVSTSPRLPAPDPRLMEPPPDSAELLRTVQGDISRWANSLQSSPSR